MKVLFCIFLFLFQGVSFAQSISLEGGSLIVPSRYPYADKPLVTGPVVVSCHNSDCRYVIKQKKGFKDAGALVFESVSGGFGWYGILGSFEHSSLVVNENIPPVCGVRGGCMRLPSHFSVVKKERQIYGGVGISYHQSLTKQVNIVWQLGVAGNVNRDKELFATRHQFQLAIKGEYKLDRHVGIVAGYTHSSNGYDLRIPGSKRPNAAVERLSFGMRYTF
ncbi:MAG: hypothetical protein HYV45_00915 [Candidatus Moranbacteria bacterium]|nr:hypothetical protein [Candidatus Moranbacteria bacterium]